MRYVLPIGKAVVPKPDHDWTYHQTRVYCERPVERSSRGP